jgi:hypothetical protein
MTLVIELEANLEEEFKKNFKDLLKKSLMCGVHDQ